MTSIDGKQDANKQDKVCRRVMCSQYLQHSNLVLTSVSCAVGPSVSMSSTDFSFQKPGFFGIYLNFQPQKSLK